MFSSNKRKPKIIEGGVKFLFLINVGFDESKV
jgi:hypothetical protein